MLLAAVLQAKLDETQLMGMGDRPPKFIHSDNAGCWSTPYQNLILVQNRHIYVEPAKGFLLRAITLWLDIEGAIFLPTTAL